MTFQFHFWKTKHRTEQNELFPTILKQYNLLDSGCGAVGRAVNSDTKDPRFKSSHLLLTVIKLCLKTIFKKKQYNS